MTIKEELIRYAHGCIRGNIIACNKHKWACKRMLRDFDREEEEDFPYYWDENRAQNIVDWFAMLRHSKGILAGQPIILTTWQKFVLCQIYGWRRCEDGKRRFKKSFCEVSRKNAKSQMEGGTGLYECGVTATENGEVAEIYTAGTKRDQSKIIFNECVNMLKGSPLRTKFKITRERIVHIKTGSFIKALCKEDGQKGDGTNPALLVLDEYHQHATTEFYDLGLGSNSKEPLLMIITTAGMDLSYPCYTQEYDYCSKLLDPGNDSVENDEYFADILEADKGDDPGAVETWIKANPIRTSYAEGLEKLKGDYEIAQAVPEKMVAVRTKGRDEGGRAAENGYMDMEKWRRCKVDKMPYDLRGKEVYIGFDLSAKIDLTSVSFILPVMDGDTVKYCLYSHSFIPNEEKLRERELTDKVPYTAWRDMGYLTVTNTEIVDQSAVMDYVLQTCKDNGWAIVCLCFDPAGASKLMMDLSNEGYDVEEVYQSQRSLNEATLGFREQVYCGNVVFENNPLLTFAMGNAMIRSNQGYIKIDKDVKKKRIDPVDATLCAFKLAMYHEFSDGGQSLEEWLDSDEW